MFNLDYNFCAVEKRDNSTIDNQQKHFICAGTNVTIRKQNLHNIIFFLKKK